MKSSPLNNDNAISLLRSGALGAILRLGTLCLFLIFSPAALAQTPPTQDVPRKQSAEKTFTPLEQIATESPTPPQSGTTATMTKDPVLALALSALPGLGQIYVESYWKAPIFLVGFGAAVGFIAYNSVELAKVETILSEPDSVRSPFAQSALLRQREIFRDLRDLSIVAAVGVIGLAAVDAYVGAHLFDFDVSDDVRASLRVEPFQQRLHFALRWNSAPPPRQPAGFR